MRALYAPVIACALACVLTLSGAAAADDPSDIDKDAARTSLEQGDERMRAKDYKQALEAYVRADNIMGVPTTSIEVGRAALALGRLVLAYDAFKRTATFPKKKGEPGPFTAARKEAKELADDIKPRIPMLEVEVNGATPDVDVEVLIDEEPIDAWGRELRVDPGMHDVRAEATGYQTANRQVVMQEGERRTLVLELVPLNAPDQPTSSSDLWWTVAVVSLPIGGASLIAGAVTGGLSLSEASAVKDQCDGDRCPPEVKDKLNTSQTLAHVSTATLIVGGVGVALGIAAITIAISTGSDEEDDDDESDDDMSLSLSPTGVRLTVPF
jgi:hypothetical protein